MNNVQFEKLQNINVFVKPRTIHDLKISDSIKNEIRFDMEIIVLGFILAINRFNMYIRFKNRLFAYKIFLYLIVSLKYHLI